MTHLCQILDGVDVVMGRWRDETHAGHGVTQTGNLGGHLVTRQFATLTRLGALGHLNLQHLRVRQVGAVHAKASRSNLKEKKVKLKSIVK